MSEQDAGRQAPEASTESETALSEQELERVAGGITRSSGEEIPQ